MSKSLGNIYTLHDIIEKGFSPEALRYLLASVPYRKKPQLYVRGAEGGGDVDRSAPQL